ncbi:hypothetical protein [Tortoise microvirus 77]|nr:hypothetical protein [Tortoise microvirus 77]
MAVKDSWYDKVTGTNDYERQSWRDSYNGGRAAGDLTGNVNRQLDRERDAFQGATWSGSSTQPSAVELAQAYGTSYGRAYLESQAKQSQGKQAPQPAKPPAQAVGTWTAPITPPAPGPGLGNLNAPVAVVKPSAKAAASSALRLPMPAAGGGTLGWRPVPGPGGFGAILDPGYRTPSNVELGRRFAQPGDPIIPGVNAPKEITEVWFNGYKIPRNPQTSDGADLEDAFGEEAGEKLAWGIVMESGAAMASDVLSGITNDALWGGKGSFDFGNVGAGVNSAVRAVVGSMKPSAEAPRDPDPYQYNRW